jgi:hypothetical protein
MYKPVLGGSHRVTRFSNWFPNWELTILILGENRFWGSHPCENWLGELELDFFFKKKKKEPDGFSHENPDPILKVWEEKWVGLGLEVLGFRAVPPSRETMQGEGYKTQEAFLCC